MPQVRRSTPELEALVGLFYPSIESVGQFEEAAAEQLPDVYRRLLDHDEHMTVSMECHYEQPVDVLVLETLTSHTHYSRRSWLTRRSDGRAVQFCIVRLNVMFLDEQVRRGIESQQTPLGRVLIEHNVLREVRLLSLWKIQPGFELEQAFRLKDAAPCYGRTALIYCNGAPAVELLEIVAPTEPSELETLADSPDEA